MEKFSQKLIEAGQVVLSRLILDHYPDLGLTPEEFVFWLELTSGQQKGELFPQLDDIAKKMKISQSQVFQLLDQVVSKGLLQIMTTKDDKGRQTDTYDFQPLYDKLEKIILVAEKKAEEQVKDDEVSRLYQLFSEEFGRPLSPLEYERIAGWLEEDHYQPELIRLALKEAVTHQARSLSYIDRILLNWESKNIQNKEEVLQEQSRRKLALLQKEVTETTEKTSDMPPITLHNPFREE